MKNTALVKTFVVVVFLVEALVPGCDSTDVAFKASQEVDKIGWMTKFNFSKVELNKGRGFQTDDNAFVVPVTGTYLFNIFIGKDQKKDAYPVSLRANEIPTPLTVTNLKPFSSSAVLELDEGESVTVWHNGDNLFIYRDAVTVTFSGTLIHKSTLQPLRK